MLRLYSVTIIYVTLFTTKYIFVADENEPRFRRLRSLFEDPMTEVYLLFYQSSLQAFINFNMFLQREDPIIPVVHEQTTSFLRKLGSKFLTVAAIKEADGDFSTLNFEEAQFQHTGKVHRGHTLLNSSLKA